MMKSNKIWIVVLIAIVLTMLIRLLPHPLNFTPVGALALFSGALLSHKKGGFLLPIGGLFLSDVILEIIKPGNGLYPGMAAVYGSFFLIIALGYLLKNKRNLLRIAALSVLSSVLFFLLTNFNFWYVGGLYPLNFHGLMESYYMGLPFFRNTLLGDLFFNALFFGSYFILVSKSKKRTEVMNAG